MERIGKERQGINARGKVAGVNRSIVEYFVAIRIYGENDVGLGRPRTLPPCGSKGAMSSCTTGHPKAKFVTSSKNHAITVT